MQRLPPTLAERASREVPGLPWQPPPASFGCAPALAYTLAYASLPDGRYLRVRSTDSGGYEAAVVADSNATLSPQPKPTPSADGYVAVSMTDLQSILLPTASPKPPTVRHADTRTAAAIRDAVEALLLEWNPRLDTRVWPIPPMTVWWAIKRGWESYFIPLLIGGFGLVLGVIWALATLVDAMEGRRAFPPVAVITVAAVGLSLLLLDLLVWRIRARRARAVRLHLMCAEILRAPVVIASPGGASHPAAGQVSLLPPPR